MQVALMRRAFTPVRAQSARPMRVVPRRPAVSPSSPLQPATSLASLVRPLAPAVAAPPQPQQPQQQPQQRVQQPQQQEETSLSLEVLSLVALSTAVAFICSIDRAAMSVAVLPMSEQFHWDDSIKGAVSSAFFAGYMVTNLCGGYLATRYSSKGVLALGVVLWSIFTLATPTAAASGSLSTLMLARSVMGVGEGVTYPSIQNLVRRWVPEDSRSRALSFIYSGHQLGTIASYLLAPYLISHYGWESVFWVFGSLGLPWALAWMLTVRNSPADQPPLLSKVEPAPKAVAAVAAEEPLRLQDVPWGKFFTNPAFLATVAAQTTSAVGNCLSFSWLPTYYNEAFGVDVMQSSAYTIIPFVATVLATNASGWIADGLNNNQVLDRTTTRKLMQSIASFGPALVLLKLAGDSGSSAHSINDAVAYIVGWLALSGFAASGYGSNHQDISSKYSGILYGLSNGLASIAGSVSIYLTGQVLHTTHDWGLIFEAAAASYLVGALVYLKWASCEEQFGGEPAAPGARRQHAH